jgi:hypothetical protein
LAFFASRADGTIWKIFAVLCISSIYLFEVMLGHKNPKKHFTPTPPASADSFVFLMCKRKKPSKNPILFRIHGDSFAFLPVMLMMVVVVGGGCVAPCKKRHIEFYDFVM